MDNYKYIEELLEKYWACTSTLEEEQALREFFLQEQELPARLQQYQTLFSYLQEEEEVQLPDDFETKLLEKMAATSQPKILSTPRRVSFSHRTSFFFKIAAGILLLLSIGFFTHQHRQTQKQAAARETIITAIGLLADNLQQGETLIDDGLKQLEILFAN